MENRKEDLREQEAEKAVEKLKAWKRLKDAGLYASNEKREYSGKYGKETIECVLFRIPEMYEGINFDLDLFFGGEE